MSARRTSRCSRNDAVENSGSPRAGQWRCDRVIAQRTARRERDHDGIQTVCELRKGRGHRNAECGSEFLGRRRIFRVTDLNQTRIRQRHLAGECLFEPVRTRLAGIAAHQFPVKGAKVAAKPVTPPIHPMYAKSVSYVCCYGRRQNTLGETL